MKLERAGGEDDGENTWESIRKDILTQLTKMRERFEELFEIKRKQSKNGVKKHARAITRIAK
jgi:hypothetical protein